MNSITEVIADRSRFSALIDALDQLFSQTDALCHGNRTDQLIRDAFENATRQRLSAAIVLTSTPGPGVTRS
jgi:hypothetical protein